MTLGNIGFHLGSIDISLVLFTTWRDSMFTSGSLSSLVCQDSCSYRSI